MLTFKLGISRTCNLKFLTNIKYAIYRNRTLGPLYFRLRGIKGFSKNNLDRKIEKYLDYKNGYYVEIGANNGIQQSNTKYFETFKGWRGVLIEPAPSNFEELKKTRSKNNFFANSACVDFDYKLENIELIYSDLMTITLGIENDLVSIEKHIEDSEEYLKKGNVHRFVANARTMQNILNEAKSLKNIDLLSLDVEGSELSVLRGINHSEYRFKYILIECRDIDKMQKYLHGVGYVLVEKMSIHDYLFKDESGPSI